MNTKAVIAVVVVAVLIGVLYVMLEKSFTGSGALSQAPTSSEQVAIKLPDQPTTTVLPTPEPTFSPIDKNSSLAQEAGALQMRDYSGLFEDLKSKVSK